MRLVGSGPPQCACAAPGTRGGKGCDERWWRGSSVPALLVLDAGSMVKARAEPRALLALAPTSALRGGRGTVPSVWIRCVGVTRHSRGTWMALLLVLCPSCARHGSERAPSRAPPVPKRRLPLSIENIGIEDSEDSADIEDIGNIEDMDRFVVPVAELHLEVSTTAPCLLGRRPLATRDLLLSCSFSLVLCCAAGRRVEDAGQGGCHSIGLLVRLPRLRPREHSAPPNHRLRRSVHPGQGRRALRPVRHARVSAGGALLERRWGRSCGVGGVDKEGSVGVWGAARRGFGRRRRRGSHVVVGGTSGPRPMRMLGGGGRGGGGRGCSSLHRGATARGLGAVARADVRGDGSSGRSRLRHPWREGSLGVRPSCMLPGEFP